MLIYKKTIIKSKVKCIAGTIILLLYDRYKAKHLMYVKFLTYKYIQCILNL